MRRHGGGRVDGLQLEFGAFLRSNDVRNQVADVVAEAISRAIHPMPSFLKHVSSKSMWTQDQQNTVDTVVAKSWTQAQQDTVDKSLASVHVYTPLDLRCR